MKRTISSILIFLIFFAPLSTVSAQTAASTAQFNPNTNISSGNTYSGVSITGIGGAIASCANIGGFLINQASSLLSSTSIGKKFLSSSSFSGGGSAVDTSDQKAQQALATANRTTQCLDGVAYAVAKNTLAQITNKTLNWVNTGLNGNPLYVQNVQSYLGSISTLQTNSFLNTVQNSDPIFGNALRSAITLSVTGKSDGLINVTLNTPQALSYNSFQSDFTNGGWNALLNPSYNPVGAFFNAVDTLNTNVSTQQQQASNEIQRNNGFLDMKQCVKYADTAAAANTNTSLTTQLTTSTQKSNGYIPGAVCTQWSTTTPGSVIASQVQTITNTPVQQLVYANKINEVLGGFFDSFVNNLMTKGLRGSGPSGTPSVNGGYASEGNNFVANTTGAADTAALGYQAATSGDVNTGDFDISHPQQLRAVLQTQENFLNSTLDAQIALERIIPAIGALDYCIPGPTPEWRTGLDSNWQTFLSAIQQAPANSPSTLASIAGALPFVGGLFDVFFNNSKPPPIWTINSALSDKITGGNISLNRTFYDPHNGDETTSNVQTALQSAYTDIVNQLNYYTIPGNTFAGSNVGKAFQQAAASDADPAYVNGFLQDAYTNTDSLPGYNQASTTIDQTYNQNISDTQNTIEQMKDILNQVDSIVSKAKTDYIKANPTVNVQCLDQAYVVDTSPIIVNPRIEPNAQNIEEDAIVQHSIQSASYFYGSAIK